MNYLQELFINYTNLRQYLSLKLKMKRNKMVPLMEIKRIKYSDLKRKQPYIINHSYSQWEQSYYRKKDLITDIQKSNQNIKELVKAYEHNSSVYNLKMLQKLVHVNCQKINQCDQIISIQQSIVGSDLMAGTMHSLNQNVKRNFRNIIFQQIKKLFQAKATISEITSHAQQKQRSFNAFNNTQNISYTQLNSKSLFPGQDRQSSFNEVNTRIQGLNIILKRLNVLVSEQGELINNIDQNMKKGTQNMVRGRKVLQQRSRRQQGAGQFQFSFHGRINQAITALYGVNVFLIVVWVVKNLI